MTEEKRIIILASDETVHTPGVIRWLQSCSEFEDDRPMLLKVLVGTYGKAFSGGEEMISEIFHRLLMGKIEWTEDENKSVVFYLTSTQEN